MLSWRPARHTALDSFRLLVGSAPGGSDLAVVEVGAVTAFFAEAPPGTYYVGVAATNACGTSGPSNGIAVVVTPGPVLPPAPANLRALVDGLRVIVEWDAVAGATSYVLEAGMAPGVIDVSVPVGTPMYANAAVTPGTYYVRVRAVGPSGAGVPSPDIVVVVP